ncbi:hypothetical protein VIGAN_01109300, partial [Vigna angularis var. angularis]
FVYVKYHFLYIYFYARFSFYPYKTMKEILTLKRDCSSCCEQSNPKGHHGCTMNDGSRAVLGCLSLVIIFC